MPEIASKLSWVSHAYVPLRPARMPAGASLVTLIDMCSRPIAKRGVRLGRNPTAELVV